MMYSVSLLFLGLSSNSIAIKVYEVGNIVKNDLTILCNYDWW
jgi:hypothetical protein